MSDIKVPDVRNFIDRFRDFSGSVLKHIRATLSVLFGTAVNRECIRHNPINGVRLPGGKPVERVRVSAPEEIGLLVRHLVEPYRTMVIIIAGTAIRDSELLALKWADFDWLQRIITVRRSLYRGRIDATKSRKGSRDIPFGNTVAEAVQALHRSQWNRGEYLFLTERGKIQPSRRRTVRISAGDCTLPTATVYLALLSVLGGYGAAREQFDSKCNKRSCGTSIPRCRCSTLNQS